MECTAVHPSIFGRREMKTRHLNMTSSIGQTRSVMGQDVCRQCCNTNICNAGSMCGSPSMYLCLTIEWWGRCFTGSS